MSKPKFLIIGNQNAVVYKILFPLIKSNQIVFGYTIPSGFKQPDGTIAKIGALTKWFSNLDVYKQYKNIELTKEYYNKDGTVNSDKFPTYDNYDAINVNKVSDIPKDYFGNIGVPITFLDKYNPEQFEIIGLSSRLFANINRIHECKYYTGYKRGKVITGIDSNMPIMNIPNFGGITCKRENSPDVYQLYHRLFIKRKVKHPKFLIIGNTNALTYKEIFPLFKNNKIWTGYTNFNVGMYFEVPDSYEKYHKIKNNKKLVRVSTSCWFSNLDVSKRHEDLILYEKYYNKDGTINSDKFPIYDNYDAIDVSKFHEIPKDYFGVMGVPITFLDKLNPEQFKIYSCSAYSDINCNGCGALYINNKKVYARILIKRKEVE